MICDSCGKDAATVDHLDMTVSEGQFKRLCPPCGDMEKRRWERERQLSPALAMSAARPSQR